MKFRALDGTGPSARRPGDQGTDLPDGWAVTTLGDICSHPQYGWTTSADKRAVGPRFLRTTDISGGAVDWSTVPGCMSVPEDDSRYLLEPGDLLISRAGSVGFSYLVKEAPRAIFASYLIRFRAHVLVSSEYVALYLKSPAYWSAIQEQTVGIGIPNVNASKLKAIAMPLPPVPEQKRIVEQLEALLARVDASQGRLAKVPLILRRFRQSVLAAACSGRLTGDWGDRNGEVEPASV